MFQNGKRTRRKLMKKLIQGLLSVYSHLKGGHLDFSRLTELKYIYITEIYMRKEHKSSKSKNIFFFLMGVL